MFQDFIRKCTLKTSHQKIESAKYPQECLNPGKHAPFSSKPRGLRPTEPRRCGAHPGRGLADWGAELHRLEAGSRGMGAGSCRLGAGHSPQVDQEGVLQPLHDLQFPEHVAHLIPLDALLLVHVLHRVHLLRVSLLHDAYLSDSKGENVQVNIKQEKISALTASLCRGSSLRFRNLPVEQLWPRPQLLAPVTWRGCVRFAWLSDIYP